MLRYAVGVSPKTTPRPGSELTGRGVKALGGHFYELSFGKRLPAMPGYAAFLIPLLAVMALRLIAMAARPRGRTAAAG